MWRYRLRGTMLERYVSTAGLGNTRTENVLSFPPITFIVCEYWVLLRLLSNSSKRKIGWREPCTVTTFSFRCDKEYIKEFLRIALDFFYLESEHPVLTNETRMTSPEGLRNTNICVT